MDNSSSSEEKFSDCADLFLVEWSKDVGSCLEDDLLLDDFLGDTKDWGFFSCLDLVVDLAGDFLLDLADLADDFFLPLGGDLADDIFFGLIGDLCPCLDGRV